MKIVRKTRYFLRFKYRKGHNIHSPFVYNLFSEVFMKNPSNDLKVDKDLYESFMTRNVKPRHAMRWCQLADYMKSESIAVDPEVYNGENMVVVSSIHCVTSLDSILIDMQQADKRVVLIVNGINKNREGREWWSTVKDNVIFDFNSFGVIVFDRLLSSKKYKFKL